LQDTNTAVKSKSLLLQALVVDVAVITSFRHDDLTAAMDSVEQERERISSLVTNSDQWTFRIRLMACQHLFPKQATVACFGFGNKTTSSDGQ